LFIPCRFGSPDAYELLPHAAELVAALRARGILVGVITNSDERYQDSVLPSMGVNVDLALCSRSAAVSKPSKSIFTIMEARAKELYKATLVAKGTWADQHGLKPEHCVHVGNEVKKDVNGALGAGWKAVWMCDPYKSAADKEAYFMTFDQYLAGNPLGMFSKGVAVAPHMKELSDLLDSSWPTLNKSTIE
jgi:FMN phosphatase YigB (HAD superfamily)